MQKTLSLLLCSLLTLLTVGCQSASPASASLQFDASKELFPQIVQRTDEHYTFLNLGWGISRDEALAKLSLTDRAVSEMTDTKVFLPFYSDELKASGRVVLYFSQSGLCLGQCFIETDRDHQQELAGWAERYRDAFQLSGVDWTDTGTLSGSFEDGDEVDIQFCERAANEGDLYLIISVGRHNVTELNFESFVSP